MAIKTPHTEPVHTGADSAFSPHDELLDAPADGDHSATLERLALEHARCDDAASACWYLCRSLGAARQLEPDAPGLELLFELLGALADLPELVQTEPAPPAEGEADGLGVYELCEQLAAAREASQAAWRELSLGEEEAASPLLSRALH